MKYPPLVSVILPIRNEYDFIERALRSICGQDYPASRLEIFVVDGMSTDGTRQKVAHWIESYPEYKFQMIDNPSQIVPTALNLACQQARGEIVIRVDGHCIIAPDYISRCVDHLLNRDVDAVGGPMETIGETTTAETIAAAMSSTFGVGDSAFRTRKDKTLLVDSVPFPAYRRETIEHAGLFDEELVRNQDDEYNFRLRKLGMKVLMAVDVRSKYHSRSSFKSLFKQYFQYGFWKVRVFQKHPGQMRPRHFVPLLFVTSILVSLVISLSSSWGWISLATILGTYLATNLIASTVTAARSSWKTLPRLPVAFSILHVSYGLGFLVGLVKFFNRWGDKQGKVPVLREVHA